MVLCADVKWPLGKTRWTSLALSHSQLFPRTPRLAERFILYMLHFAGTGAAWTCQSHGMWQEMKLSPGGDAPLVRPVPFLPERFVKQAPHASGLEGKVFCIRRFWRLNQNLGWGCFCFHVFSTLLRSVIFWFIGSSCITKILRNLTVSRSHHDLIFFVEQFR